MIERQKHLDAFEYFIELGAKAGDENIEKIGGKYGVTANTIWRWYKAFNWRDRAIIRLVATKKKLEADGILSKEAEIASLLTLIDEKIAENKLRSGYLKALYGQAKQLIEAGDIKLKTMDDMLALSKAMDFADKGIQELIKLKLVVMGEPDSRADVTGNIGFTLYDVAVSQFPEPFDMPEETETQ